MPAILTEHFKIFKPDYAVNGNSGDLCFLSAHGSGRSNSPASFMVPQGLTILMPGLPGEAVGMPPVHASNNQAYKLRFDQERRGEESDIVVQRLKEGQPCPNYELSKYQGRHNSAWPGFISYPITRVDKWKDTFGDEHYSEIEAAMGAGFDADVVTVRNRPFTWHTPTLWDLVNHLDNSLVYNYTYLFCSFCFSTSCCGGGERWHARA